jgi:hypothetical protein
MQSKGNVLFSGFKRLIGFGTCIKFQRMLFIALIVLYLVSGRVIVV